MLDGENIAYASSEILETRTCILQKKSKVLLYAHPIKSHREFY